MNSSFIGASNDPLNTLLRDETSARRFWDTPTLAAKELQKNWAAIDALDYVALWQGIDEKEASPHQSVLQQIREIQEVELRPKGHFEEWASSELVADVKAFTPTSVLNNDFRLWAQNRGLKFSYTEDTFGKKLSALGVYFKKTQSIRDKRVRGFAVRTTGRNAESPWERR